jgi:hypothetical protein
MSDLDLDGKKIDSEGTGKFIENLISELKTPVFFYPNCIF